MAKAIRKLLSGGVVAGGALTLALATAPSAAAHISASSDTTVAGSYALVSFGVPHGCGDSATTEVRISIPEGINAVTPTVNPGWDLVTVTEQLADPGVDSHGEEVTERISEVVYTAHEPLPADVRDAFDLSMRLPEDTAGQTLYFPAVQSCEEGESAWIQRPAEGQDPHELDLPAPDLTVTAAGDTADDADTTDIAQATDATEGDQNVFAWSIGALVIGILALVVGLVALVRAGRK